MVAGERDTGQMSSIEQRLSGRVAIVTGASRGLGRAIAVAFGREGAAVAVVARTETQWDARLPGTIHDTLAEIEAAGGRALPVVADLARPDDVETLPDRVRAELGPVDIRVNNAALTVPGRPPAVGEAPRVRSTDPAARRYEAKLSTSFLDFPLKGYRLHFEVGVFASYRLMQLVLPDMAARAHGSIINISSLAALIPGEGPYEHTGVPGPIAYGGNKAALEHLTQSVAIEFQAHGIGVNALSPSEPVITPGNLVAAAGETDWASPEDFAEATVRVALADPSEVNGQILWSDDVLHPERGRRGWLR